jgi:hypothetical protein
MMHQLMTSVARPCQATGVLAAGAQRSELVWTLLNAALLMYVDVCTCCPANVC